MKTMINSIIMVSFLLTLILSAQSSQALVFSVQEDDELLYHIDTSDGAGLLSVEVSSIDTIDEELIHGATLDKSVTGRIIGEFVNNPVTDVAKYGWYAPLFVNITTDISVRAPYNIGLYSLVNEGIYPFFWPLEDSFYRDLANINYFHGVSISTEKRDTTWIIQEYVDNIAVDGCLCETTFEIENGVAVLITQNETSYFAPSDPLIRTAKVTLEENEGLLGFKLSINFSNFILFSLLVSIIRKKT